MADIQRAIEIAVEAHKGQVQKNGMPYVLHPLTLMTFVDTPNAKIAAILHDVVEDTDWSLEMLSGEKFSDEVMAALDCLTHREGESYEEYIDRIRPNPLATQVKLADLKDNMNTLRIPNLSERDLERLAKYHKTWFSLGGRGA